MAQVQAGFPSPAFAEVCKVCAFRSPLDMYIEKYKFCLPYSGVL